MTLDVATVLEARVYSILIILRFCRFRTSASVLPWAPPRALRGTPQGHQRAPWVREVARPWFGPTLFRDFLGRGSPSCETRVSANQGFFTDQDFDAIFGAPQSRRHERPRSSRLQHSNPGGASCRSSASVAQITAAASIKVMDALFGLVARNDAEWSR